MEYKDYYQVMGVSRDATPDEIKRAYRQLARKYHPDVSKQANAAARFKEIGEAYAVLKDPKKRAAYDQLGTGWKSGEQFQAPPDWGKAFGFQQRTRTAGSGGSGFSEFFESLFGSAFGSGFQEAFGGRFRQNDSHHGRMDGRGRYRGQTGASAGAGQTRDIHTTIRISLKDACQGATRTLVLKVPELQANGTTQTRVRKLNVRIPKGVSEGQSIRLAGQGHPGGRGRPSGDLYLKVAFEDHPVFRVEGRDVLIDFPVAPWEAALGTVVEAPTPTGRVSLRIPPDSATDQRLRLKGRGIPANPPGDLYVILKVVLPPSNGDAAKTAWRNMEKLFNFHPRQQLWEDLE